MDSEYPLGQKFVWFSVVKGIKGAALVRRDQSSKFPPYNSPHIGYHGSHYCNNLSLTVEQNQTLQQYFQTQKGHLFRYHKDGTLCSKYAWYCQVSHLISDRIKKVIEKFGFHRGVYCVFDKLHFWGSTAQIFNYNPCSITMSKSNS